MENKKILYQYQKIQNKIFKLNKSEIEYIQLKHLKRIQQIT